MRLRDLAGKNVVVWGAAREGGAVLRAAQRLGIDINATVIDESSDAQSFEGHPVVGGEAGLALLDSADVVVRSPGVSRYRPEVQSLVQRGIPVTTATNLWFAEGFERVIAVTGTKGKSTTSSLIAHLLTSLGHEAQLAGNIGQNPIDLLEVVQPQWWVLELSSFQTSELEHSPNIGVLTTLSPEHLDWHGDYEHYVNDKLNLFAHKPDIATVANTANAGVREVFNRLPNAVAVDGPDGVTAVGGAFSYGGSALFPLTSMHLVGRHNVELACVALTALAQTGIDLIAQKAEIEEALSTFQALPHRLSPVGEREGVLYIDDGLATTPIATMAAIDAFADRPTTLLLGGHDRGVSYDELGAFINQHSNVVVLTMPANGPRIADAITRTGNKVSITATEGLSDAVLQAAAITPPGGVVLLSPAAASFGAFRDYVARSDAFVAAVQELPA